MALISTMNTVGVEYTHYLIVHTKFAAIESHTHTHVPPNPFFFSSLLFPSIFIA